MAVVLLFALAACSSTAHPRPDQRPASTAPVTPPPTAGSLPAAAKVSITDLAVDGHPVASGGHVTVTGAAAARQVTGRFTAAAPPGDRFFALTTPFTSASTPGHASYVQGEIIPRGSGAFSVAVSIGTSGSYPPHPDQVTIVLATPSQSGTLASYEGRPGTLRPVPAKSWQALGTVTVTRDPSPAAASAPAAEAPPAVGIAGLAVDGHPVASGGQVTVTGLAAARQVTGRFTAAAPAGDRFFALTTPLSSTASYVQGEIIPGASGAFSVTVGIGASGSYPPHPDRVTIVLATPTQGTILAGYEGRPGTLRPVPALTWRTLATITVTRKAPASSPSPTASPSPPANVAVADLAVDGHPVASGGQLTVTGPAPARQVTGRFTAAAPAGDRFFALTTPFTSASTPGEASYVQGEIIPRTGRSFSVTVSIGSSRSYPAFPDRVEIVLATPAVAATLASYEGQPGTLRPVPALTWQALAGITVTRKAPSPASNPSPSASPSPAVSEAVAGLVVDGHPVASGGQVTVTGPHAARQVTGRFTAAAPPGDRFFALTTPFTSASTPGQASYVQSEILPAADRSWSVTVSIGPDGAYPAHPDQVEIVMATPSVAATLASYEGQPGTLRPVPALTWQPLATIIVTREPPSAAS